MIIKSETINALILLRRPFTLKEAKVIYRSFGGLGAGRAERHLVSLVRDSFHLVSSGPRGGITTDKATYSFQLPSKPPEIRMGIAEQVWMIVKELNPEEFSWTDVSKAYDAVYGAHHWYNSPTPNCKKYIRSREYLNMSVANIIRAQRSHGAIKKVARGKYVFSNDIPVQSKWYVSAGSWRDRSESY
jgi:hypothetical protein